MKKILIALLFMIMHSNFFASEQNIHRSSRTIIASRQKYEDKHPQSAPVSPSITHEIYPATTPPPLSLTSYPFLPPPPLATRLKSLHDNPIPKQDIHCLWTHDNTHAPQQFETAAAITILLQQITGQEPLQYKHVSISSMNMSRMQYVMFKTCRNAETEIAASKFSVTYNSTYPETKQPPSIFDVFQNSEERSYETNGFCKKTTSQFSSIISRSSHLTPNKKIMLASILHAQRSGKFICTKHEDSFRIAIEFYDQF